MATKSRTTRTNISAGPFKGVFNTRDPYDDDTSLLVDATNCFIPDPANGSGMYARRGFQITNLNDPYVGRGQAVFCHVGSSSTENFEINDGRLFRLNANLSTRTDVTPVGITIDADQIRVYACPFGEQLVINDEINPPWIASDLSSTPITGTYIDYDGLGTPWSAYGRPTEYSGSLFFILNEVDGVKARSSLTWSAPGDASIGYQQNPYDFTWYLIQTGGEPLYAIWGTNIGLFYFRDKSIGLIAGTPGPDLQSSHTSDAIASNVGCLQSATIAQWGNTLFFCDAQGRPYAMQLGGPLIPIWLKLRSVVDDSTAAYPTATARVSCAAIDPSLNLYIAPIWSPTKGAADPPLEAQVFDCKSLAYLGRWIISTGSTWEALGVLNDSAGQGALVVLGDEPPTNADSDILGTEDLDYVATEGSVALGITDTTSHRYGVIWSLNGLSGDGIPLTTEDEIELTTEDGVDLTTENTTISWKDHVTVPQITATTNRLGFSSDAYWNVDQCTVIAGSTAPCLVTMQTASSYAAVQGTPTPIPSFDSTYRLTVGCDVSGRGTQVVVSPQTADSQWALQSVGIQAIVSKAAPEDV